MPGLDRLQGLVMRLQQAGANGPLTEQQFASFAPILREELGVAEPHTAFAPLYQEWRSLSGDLLHRGVHAGYLLQLVPMMRFYGPCCTGQEMEELKSAALSISVPDPRWYVLVLTITGIAPLYGVPESDDSAQLERSMDSLTQALSRLPGDAPERPALEAARAAARGQLAQLSGSDADLTGAVTELERLAGRPGVPDVRGHLSGLRAVLAVQQHDAPGMETAIREMEAVLASLPRHAVERAELAAFLDNTRQRLHLMRPDTGSSPMPPPPGLAETRQRAARQPAGVRVVTLLEEGLRVGGHGAITRTEGPLADGLALLEEAVGLLTPDDDRWIRAMTALGTGHLLMSALTRRRYHLDHGIDLLDKARQQAGGVQHPLWSGIIMALARALRLRATTARELKAARDTAFESLQGLTWNVLLQSGTDHATDAGVHAAETATELARWCLADNAAGQAAQALDTGRALVLHAARVTATAAQMLTELGQPDLAAQWRTAPVTPAGPAEAAWSPAAPPSADETRLRRRMMRVLAASPYRRELLESTPLDRTAAALRAMKRDALVYLIPAGHDEARRQDIPGRALVIPAEGEPFPVELPKLRLDAPELIDYETATERASGRDAGGPPPGHPAANRPARDLRDSLDDLCAWAWKAAMGQLLERLPRRFGRVPAVVLIPSGRLGVVPWHAAWQSVPNGRRYALERAQISYAPSARLLCEIAGRVPANGDDALVVGDPTGDLVHAGEEAEAIHRVFYPHGAFLDRHTADPSRVLSQVRAQRGGIVHFACHAVVEGGRRRSAHLKLALNAALSAEELTERADGRAPGVDLVCLAACRSMVSGRGYDEAFSLATAFLVAGARSVLGTLWQVPDSSTSLLMYMAHHYLRQENLTPGEALRRAQMWMLDPRRRPPARMPREMADRIPYIRPGDLAGWAGFTHSGW